MGAASFNPEYVAALISATKDDLEHLEQETRREAQVIRRQLTGGSPSSTRVGGEVASERGSLGAAAMQTRPPGAGSSVVARIHRNQVSSGLPPRPDVEQLFTHLCTSARSHDPAPR